MKPLPNQCLATHSYPRRPCGGRGEGKGVGNGGCPFPGPCLCLWPGLSSSFFNDQFLVLDKKKKAKEREFEIYRKQYQCFVSIVFRLPHVHILPSLGLLLQLLVLLLHRRFCSSRESRQCRMSAPDWHRRKLQLEPEQNSFPFLSHPSLSALPTCFSLGPQGHEKELPLTSSPLDRVLGRGSFAGEQPVFGELRAEAGGWAKGTHQVSVVHQHGGNQML